MTSTPAACDVWLEALPNRWQALRLKYVASCNDEVLSEGTSSNLEIEYVDIGSVSGIGLIENAEQLEFKDAPSRARRVVRDGDILVSTVRTYLKAIAPVFNPTGNLIASTGFAVIRSGKTVFPRFMAYCLRTEGFVNEVISLSVGISYPAINSTDLINIEVPVPSLPEQKQIAAFLDYETAKIDALIAKQQQLIALLGEKRQAVISHAVTKGLDPDVPMRDSGVEWLGEVPKHWVVMPFRHVFEIAGGQVDPRVPPYAGMPLIAPNHIESGTGRLLGIESAQEQGAISGKYIVSIGDIIYSKIRPSLRKVVLAPANCLCSADMYALRPNGGGSAEFFTWFLLSEYFSGIVVLEAMRVAMPKANRESLAPIRVPVPPIKEQVEIACKLQQRTQKLDDLESKANDQVELLRERRTALISAAVTGKIDVRGWKPPESTNIAIQSKEAAA